MDEGSRGNEVFTSVSLKTRAEFTERREDSRIPWEQNEILQNIFRQLSSFESHLSYL